MKQAAILGLIYGAITISISAIGMLLTEDYTLSWSSAAVGFLLPFLILIVGGRFFLRKIEDVDLSYGVAVKFLFVSALIGSIMGVTYSTVAYGNNEEMMQAYVETSKEASKTGLRIGMDMAGSSKAEIERALEEHQEKIDSGEIDFSDSNPFSMSKLPLNIGSTMVMALIYALISAIFVRVKHPHV